MCNSYFQSTGGSTGEDEDDVLSASGETKQNTQNENVERDLLEVCIYLKLFQ